MNDYDYSSGMGNNGGLVALIFGVLLIPLLICWLITAIGKWKTFEKAGKPGWAAIIPIYNTIVTIEIVGKPMWWIAILLLVPCANIIFAIWLINLLAKSFGKSEGFTIGLILFPFIFYPILGFGSATYQGPSAKEAQAVNFPQDPFNTNPPQV